MDLCTNTTKMFLANWKTRPCRRFPLVTAILLMALLYGLARSPVWGAEPGAQKPAAQLTQAKAKAGSVNPAPDASPAEPAREETRRLSFSTLINRPAMTLRTSNGSSRVDFSTRSDELVTRAVLKLRYAYSPSLIPSQSQIRVLLNGELMSVLPVTKENAGRMLSQDLVLDPRFITGFNQLTLEFIGHYGNECEDPRHTSLWADISGTSVLELSTIPLALKPDLASLPAPFFDDHDRAILKLPHVFAAKPSFETLAAAGITASWFGKLAAWRGSRFPAYLDAMPKGHVVAFATNAERPAFLSELPEFKGAGLSIMTNPADGISKVLLVSGRDASDLKMAATSLVLGKSVMSGVNVNIAQSTLAAPRKAYDAPNWIRLDRPMKFGELVESVQQLEVSGHESSPIRINFRVPPDLFPWHGQSVPVDLKYRYTAPIRSGESRLVMGINDEFVQGFNLRSSGEGGSSGKSLLPFLDQKGLMAERSDAQIPAYKLGARNQMQYAFTFTYHGEGVCRDTQVENARAMIDPDSTIDFSGLPHYTELPNLGYFVQTGFPFSKYADLAQTTVVMPQQASAFDIETMLTLLGRLGESTGYPATRVTVTGAQDEAAFKDRDLILIGASPNQTLLDKWGAQLPAVISGPNRRISQPVHGVSFLYDWLGFGTKPNTEVATQENIQGTGALAALLGFQSPVTPGRSVVAVTAVQDKGLLQVLDVLADEGLARTMAGSTVFIRGGKPESILVGPTYSVGEIPLWMRGGYWLSQHPRIATMLTAVGAILLVYLLWRILKLIIRRRTLPGT
jgi:hypothetical protein